MAEPLWDGGPVLTQAPGVFPLSTDSILLADFAAPRSRERLLDLGTGGGVLPLLLLWEKPGVSCTALELEPAACRAAAENFRQNGLTDRVTLIHGDLRDHRELFPSGSFDLVLSNPPYFPQAGGAVARGAMGAARSDGTCTPEDLCAAAGWALRWGGRFCLVYRPERLPRLFSALGGCGLEPKRIRPVHHSPGHPVGLILLEARRGGKPGLRWEPDLILFDNQGRQTAEALRIYRRKE